MQTERQKAMAACRLKAIKALESGDAIDGVTTMMVAIQANENTAFVRNKEAIITMIGMKIAKEDGKDGVRKWIQEFPIN